jgi:hypothetical protein
MRDQLFGSLFGESPVHGLALAVFLGLGLGYTIYTVFFGEETLDDVHKLSMLWFAVIVNAYSGISAGIHVIRHSGGSFILFPIWNILSCVFLLFLFYFEIIDEDSIIDKRVTLAQVIIGSLLVIGLFCLCQFVWHLHWGVTFSICVTYASSVSSFYLPRSKL